MKKLQFKFLIWLKKYKNFDFAKINRLLRGKIMADFAINSLDKWNKLVYHSKTIFILTIVIITLTIFFGFLSGIRWGVYGGIAIFVGVLIAWGISFGVTSLVIDAIL